MTLPAAAPLETLPVTRIAPRPSTRVARRLQGLSLGGGTGLPVVIRGLTRHVRPWKGRRSVDLTAVVAMSDDGGSSGRLRRTRGLLPPGDIRNCLVALSGGQS